MPGAVLGQEVVELRPPSKATFIRLRKQGQSKHILGGLKVAWRLIYQNLWTTGPAALAREALYKQLFLNRKCSMNDEVYKGRDRDRWNQWNYHRSILWHNMHNNAPLDTVGTKQPPGSTAKNSNRLRQDASKPGKVIGKSSVETRHRE